jgi:hypothetical protein
MKKIILYMTVATLMLSGCSIDVNHDPNHPTSVNPALELPGAEGSLATVAGDGMETPSGIFVQYFDQLPESEQYANLVRYYITQSSAVLDRSYETLYAGTLMDLQDILNSNEVTGADKFAAECLRAYGLQLAVDNWDQAPYKEAFGGNSNTQPHWDSGKAVYKGVLNELDSVQNLIGSSSMTAEDMVNGKNMKQWIGFANALRLRMYLRFIDANVDVSDYESKVKKLLAENNFFTGDIKFDNFKDEADRRNPWYSDQYINLNTTNLCAGYAIMSYMKSTNDTVRIAYDFAKDGQGNYTGTLPAAKYAFPALKNANCSEMRYRATLPVYFFTQAELQFLIAEAQLRFNTNDAAAKSAYEAGIEADFESRGLTGASNLYNGSVAWSKATTTEGKLNLIYMQKWVSLLYRDHTEAWSEQRRTDVPKWSSVSAKEIYKSPVGYNAGDLIVPAVNALGGNNVIKREWIPYDAALYNPNTPKAIAITTPVWWDVK